MSEDFGPQDQGCQVMAQGQCQTPLAHQNTTPVSDQDCAILSRLSLSSSRARRRVGTFRLPSTTRMGHNNSARSVQQFNRQFSGVADDSVSSRSIDMQKLKENYLNITMKYDRMLKANSRLSGQLSSKDQQEDEPTCNFERIQKQIQVLDASTPSSMHSSKQISLVQRQVRETSKSKKALTSRRSFDEGESLSRSQVSHSSYSSASQLYEGGNSTMDDNEYLEGGNNPGHSVIQEEDEEDTGMDPDDPYQINRLNEISHEQLKELYTQVVDELLDIQLEFEEKLTEIEEQANIDIQDITRQKEDAEEQGKKAVERLEEDLEKHKAAIQKLSERHMKTQEQLTKERAKKDSASNQAATAVDSAEVQRLKEKIEQLTEDLKDEKKESIKLEEKYEKFESQMKQKEDNYREHQRQLAKVEIENDELRYEIRQVEFIVKDLEQKLDSQLEINELLTTEQEEMKEHLEEQNERLRQQMEEQAVELMVKEKELKKIKFNQLLIDTQSTFMQDNSAKVKNNSITQSNVQQQSVIEEPKVQPGEDQDKIESQSKDKDPESTSQKPGSSLKVQNDDNKSNSQASQGPVLPQPLSVSTNPATPDIVMAQNHRSPDQNQPAKSAESNKNQNVDNLDAQNASRNTSPEPHSSDAPAAADEQSPARMNFTDQKNSERGQIDLKDIVVQDMGDDEVRGGINKSHRHQDSNITSSVVNRINGEGAYASFAGNGTVLENVERDITHDKLLGLADLDPAEYIKNLQLDDENDESAAAALGLGDIQIDELLDCGDDLMDIEQTAFIGSSKMMLKMLDNMIQTIDSRVESMKIAPNNQYNSIQQEQNFKDIKLAA